MRLDYNVILCVLAKNSFALNRKTSWSPCISTLNHELSGLDRTTCGLLYIKNECTIVEHSLSCDCEMAMGSSNWYLIFFVMFSLLHLIPFLPSWLGAKGRWKWKSYRSRSFLLPMPNPHHRMPSRGHITSIHPPICNTQASALPEC